MARYERSAWRSRIDIRRRHRVDAPGDARCGVIGCRSVGDMLRRNELFCGNCR